MYLRLQLEREEITEGASPSAGTVGEDRADIVPLWLSLLDMGEILLILGVIVPLWHSAASRYTRVLRPESSKTTRKEEEENIFLLVDMSFLCACSITRRSQSTLVLPVWLELGSEDR